MAFARASGTEVMFYVSAQSRPGHPREPKGSAVSPAIGNNSPFLRANGVCSPPSEARGGHPMLPTRRVNGAPIRPEVLMPSRQRRGAHQPGASPARHGGTGRRPGKPAKGAKPLCKSGGSRPEPNPSQPHTLVSRERTSYDILAASFQDAKRYLRTSRGGGRLRLPCPGLICPAPSARRPSRPWVDADAQGGTATFLEGRFALDKTVRFDEMSLCEDFLTRIGRGPERA